MDFWDFQESRDPTSEESIFRFELPSNDTTSERLQQPASAPPEEIQSVIRRFCYFSKHKNVGREYRNPRLWLIPSGRTTTSRSTIWTNRVIVCNSVLSRESTTWRGPDWEPSYRWVKAYEWVRLHVPAVIVPANCTQMGDQSFSLRVTAPHQNPYFLFQNPLADELFCIIFVKT